MSQWRLRGFLVVLAAVIFSVVVIIIYRNGEPAYEGRTLTQWIDQSHKPHNQVATNAVYQIGTNAIPWLLKWALAEDSKSKKELELRRRLESHLRFHLSVRSAEERHTAARAGFRLLRDRAKPVWPTLIQWSYDKEPLRRMLSVDYLSESQADKKTFLPVLLRLIKDPDEDVRRFTAKQFDIYYPEEAEAAGVYQTFQGINWTKPNVIMTNRFRTK